MKLLLTPLGSDLPGDAAERAENRANVEALESGLDEKRAVVREGWGPDKVHKKGKLTTWERIGRLIDADSPILAVGTLVNWGREFAGSSRQAPGAGVVTAFCRVQQRWVVVIANDNTVASGAWWPLTPEKIERAQQMALRLRLPVVYLVDCSGLFLPEQSRSFPGRTGAGHIFRYNSVLSAAGVPQIAGVFGDCIAGGGYMPIISDRVTMTEQAYMVIAGAALIKGAKSQLLTSLDIGGPEVHVHQSACADLRVPDDPTCLEVIREQVAQLPTPAVESRPRRRCCRRTSWPTSSRPTTATSTTSARWWRAWSTGRWYTSSWRTPGPRCSPPSGGSVGCGWVSPPTCWSPVPTPSGRGVGPAASSIERGSPSWRPSPAPATTTASRWCGCRTSRASTSASRPRPGVCWATAAA
jgi:acetyl-CoA carboxylase carboxyltransferase component